MGFDFPSTPQKKNLMIFLWVDYEHAYWDSMIEKYMRMLFPSLYNLNLLPIGGYNIYQIIKEDIIGDLLPVCFFN